MPTNLTTPTRAAFIQNALEFAEQISRKEGVLRVAIVQEITMPMAQPEIICLLVTISEGAPIKPIAAVGRKLSGRIGSMPGNTGH